MIDECVSVVIATRNRAHAVATLCTSLNGQREIAKVVVVADACTDGTVELLHGLNLHKLVVLATPKPVGPPAARNLAMGLCDTPWIATFDDDDVPGPSFFSHMISEAVRSGADVLGAPWFNTSGGQDPECTFAVAKRTSQGPVQNHPGIVPVTAFVPTIWAHSNFLIRRTVIESGVRFNENLRYNYWREETDFLVRVLRAGMKAGVTNSTYTFMPIRIQGGVRRNRLLYELWVAINDLQFSLEHGRWCSKNGYLQSRFDLLKNSYRGRWRPMVQRRLR